MTPLPKRPRPHGLVHAMALAAMAISAPASAQGLIDPPSYRGEELRKRIEQDAFRIGMAQCGTALAKAAIFLANGQSANYVIQPMGLDLTQWPVTLTMESIDPTGPSRMAVLIMQPGCSGMYTQTITWDMNCSDVHQKMFSNFTSERTFLKNVRAFKSGINLELFLLPQAGKCTSIKKELFRGLK